MSKKDKMEAVGPIPFTGPAVDRDAAIREDEHGVPVDLEAWYQAVVAQHDAFSQADEALFRDLREGGDLG